MIKRALFWLNNSRLFSAPMTIMSWLVVFLYSLKSGGNILNGILALICLLFAHLATNLFDDYVDYRNLSKDTNFMNNTTKKKCQYLKNGDATTKELLAVIAVYCIIAFIIGVILTFRCGIGVIFLAVIGGIITLTYAKLSSNGFSEIAVGTAFGPLLFEGVYYVMCYKFSLDILIISLGIVSFTVGLVYMNNLLDFDSDIATNKKTLCCRLGNKPKAITGLGIIYFIGYTMLLLISITSKNLLYTIPLITIPLSVSVLNKVKTYYNDKAGLPKIHWWYQPLENWNKIKNTPTAAFYLRLFMARNLMIWVSFLFVISLTITK